MVNMKSLLGIVFIGCAATQAPSLEFTVETGAVTINGQKIAGTAQTLSPKGKGEAKLVQKGEDPNKYAVLRRAYDSNNDGTIDYRDYTRTDQVGLGPYRIELVVNSQDCLVLEFKYKGNARTLDKTTTVKCENLEK